MNKLIKFDTKILFIFIITILSRIPFLFNGFGVEEDSYGIVVAAKNTYETGILEVSRLPGHPVFEIVLSSLYPFCSPFLFNGLSALMSAIAIMFLTLVFKHYDEQKYWLAALAIAFTPIFYVASVYTIDYVWAAAFFSGAWYFMLKRKYYLFSLFFALSVGCRINSISLLPVFILIDYAENNEFNFKRMAIYTFLSVLLSVFFYLPVINVYGFDFFDYSDQFPYPSWQKIIYKSTIGVWGLLGFIIVFIELTSVKTWKNKNALIFVTVLVIQFLAYLKLPQKSAYLIPLIPFTILFLMQNNQLKKFAFICFAIILSSFVFGIQLSEPIRGSRKILPIFELEIKNQMVQLDAVGPVFSDYTKRLNKKEYVQYIAGMAMNINKPTAIISGWWYNQLLVEKPANKTNSDLHYVFYCNEDSLLKMKLRGWDIYYLSEQETYNNLMFNFIKTQIYAKPIEEILIGD